MHGRTVSHEINEVIPDRFIVESHIPNAEMCTDIRPVKRARALGRKVDDSGNLHAGTFQRRDFGNVEVSARHAAIKGSCRQVVPPFAGNMRTAPSDLQSMERNSTSVEVSGSIEAI